MSSICYNANIHLEEDANFKPDDCFIQAFACFISRIPANKFALIKGRRRVVCEATWQVIKILFEGQARKADANLLLTKVYTKVFKSIDMDKILPLF